MARMRHPLQLKRTARMMLAALLLSLASPAVAARDFRIGPERFSESEVLDARALPSVDGMPVIMITLAEAAALRFQKLTEAMVGQPLSIKLDGKELTAPIVREAIAGGVLEISGLPSLAEGERIARLISGKDPLPDSLEE